MKRKILLCLSLLSSLSIAPEKLENSLLKKIDQAGFFDEHIIDILQVRQKIKDFVTGKGTWQGLQVSLKTTTGNSISGFVKHPGESFGITYVALSSDYSDIFRFVTNEQSAAVEQFLSQTTSKTLLQRLDQDSMNGVFTGSYAINPFNNQEVPIYISDYAIECFDVRNTHVRLGIPAHSSKDFSFAQKHHLPIKLVVTLNATNGAAEDLPQIKDGKLQKPYTQEGNFYKIINSDFLNGTFKTANNAAIQYAQTNGFGSEYKATLLYAFNNTDYSVENLQAIESTLKKEQKELSQTHQYELEILMHYVQSDFLHIVENFILGVHKTKDMMVDLIEESCKIRHNTDCYLLHWSKLNSHESERVVFKRDITSFQLFATFCTDLVNFLGDLASSCPHALEAIKKLKK